MGSEWGSKHTSLDRVSRKQTDYFCENGAVLGAHNGCRTHSFQADSVILSALIAALRENVAVKLVVTLHIYHIFDRDQSLFKAEHVVIVPFGDNLSVINMTARPCWNLPMAIASINGA